MSEAMITAEERSEFRKAQVRRLRKAGRVPGNISSGGTESISITIDAHDLMMLLRKKPSIIEIKIGSKKQRVIVREVQHHPLHGEILHVDFIGIKKGHKVTMTIPVNYHGKPKGVTDEGGIFDGIKNELSIYVLPKDIPDSIDIEVSGLMIGDAIRVKDLPAAEYEILDDLEDVVCRVAAPRPEEEEEEEMEPEEEEMAEPEVIGSREGEEEESGDQE